MNNELSIIIPSGQIHLEGILHIPSTARGIVLFVHGSGSSRFSLRNQHVARRLNQAKFATLLFDLLTPAEIVSGATHLFEEHGTLDEVARLAEAWFSQYSA